MVSILDANAIGDYYRQRLNLDVGDREHVTVVFSDFELPAPFLEGLHSVEGTRVLVYDVHSIRSEAEILEQLYDAGNRYLSVQEYCLSFVSPHGQSAAAFASRSIGIDYTSFEFPRFDLDDDQVQYLLQRATAGVPQRELGYANDFYRLLDDRLDYHIEILSGEGLDRSFHVRGPHPWMEMCGPMVEGDIRFEPGCELFYNGADIEGTLHCSGGINLLPLRSDTLEEGLCRELLMLGAQIPADPIDLDFRSGRLVDIRSSGPLASRLKTAFDDREAFSWLVEVGIGLDDAAAPLVHSWAAPTNEAVPGVHVGVGADPGNPRRFDTLVHMDFVEPQVRINVNGHTFFDSGSFTR